MPVHYLRRSPMMRHLLDALDRGEDIGHYGRLTVALVGQYFMDQDELVGILSKDGHADEARQLVAQVEAHHYNPPSRRQIVEWQARQDFPICPTLNDPESCNVYRDLSFPDEVYDTIEAYRARPDGAQPGAKARRRTDDNLRHAIAGEAEARLKYTAFAMQAMQEGHPEIAQLFLEAAGAETIHGVSHLRAAGAIGTTRENLDKAANGEDAEIEEMYPRFVREAEAEGHSAAAASFRLALERERHHRVMFKEAFTAFTPEPQTAALPA